MRLFRIIFFALIAALNLAMFLLIGTGFNLIPFVICLIIVIMECVCLKKNKKIERPSSYFVSTLLVGVVLVWVSCFKFGFGKLGIYELKIRYADKAGYSTNHFPQSIPEEANLEDMGMLPSIMQGSGNVHATFSVDEHSIDALEKKAADAAILSFTVEQYLYGEIPKECLDKAQKIFEDKYDFEGVDATISVDGSKILKEQDELYDDSNGNDKSKLNDVVIYIIDSNFYFNHIRTDAVVVDHTGGRIEYVGQ